LRNLGTIFHGAPLQLLHHGSFRLAQCRRHRFQVLDPPPYQILLLDDSLVEKTLLHRSDLLLRLVGRFAGIACVFELFCGPGGSGLIMNLLLMGQLPLGAVLNHAPVLVELLAQPDALPPGLDHDAGPYLNPNSLYFLVAAEAPTVLLNHHCGVVLALVLQPSLCPLVCQIPLHDALEEAGPLRQSDSVVAAHPFQPFQARFFEYFGKFFPRNGHLDRPIFYLLLFAFDSSLDLNRRSVSLHRANGFLQ